MDDDQLPSDPLWYKDAIIYQLHVKAFFDANGDGIGDFQGLTRKLDYLKELGVTALWLLPFYPSPLRDDGYDIADYRSVNPAYGSLSDVRAFVRAAHRSGLRVITELVVNHTSDQHPWFQRARHAKPGSAWRDYYVWSDTDQKFLDTEIIFLDTEKSNWAWDPAAKAYYWHRFYAHQPDLNFDNPHVVREILAVMRYWLDIGVDGMRLDAVPYLIERDGTNGENLPETHAILKQLRTALDARYSDRMLLAEANQWPEDVLQYFGDNDECHMAFHFPLMPRIFMAVATEDRHPITDIMRQTPDIPAKCQWAIFLRNHDELTLAMVTNRERDYLWNHYAADKRMRLNLGIRRRLAPLMENDRRRLELLTGLMFSMPGTPVMYYGDEIAMGDNIFLGDRDGVRTPMQWSPDRNGGFSRADPAQLYLPPIMDAVYGYESVNVEAQARSPGSYLNWMKRIIAVRKARVAFGRGDLRFIYPVNRKVLAYLRSHGDETILCVFNLSRSAQAVELDLSAYKGRGMIELGGLSAFPPVGEHPYLLTLSGYAFYWFLLDAETTVDAASRAPPMLPDFLTLVMQTGWSSLFDRHNRRQFEEEVLPAYLPNQRWFAGKECRIDGVEVRCHAELGASGASWLLTVVDVALRGGGRQRYALPLAVTWADEDSEQHTALLPSILAQSRRGRSEGAIYDAAADPEFALAVVQSIADGRRVPADDGEIVFTRTGAFASPMTAAAPSVKRVGREQSSSALLIEEFAVLKLYRCLVDGIHPEIEMAEFLTGRAGFANTAPLLGSFGLRGGALGELALGALFGNVRNQGDAWEQALNYLTRYLDEALLMAPRGNHPPDTPRTDQTSHSLYLELAAQLGRRTAELHRALCPDEPADEAFRPEPVTDEDLAAWRAKATRGATATLDVLARRRNVLGAGGLELAERVLGQRDRVILLLETLLPAVPAAVKTRLHGDFQLGRVVVVQNDYLIVDFEGAPGRPPAERRRKASPLADVAGMMRSYAYAGASGVRRMTDIQPAAAAILEERAEEWRRQVTDAFLARYLSVMDGAGSLPADRADIDGMLAFFMLEKALDEVAGELASRPGRTAIPLAGILAIIEARAADHPVDAETGGK